MTKLQQAAAEFNVKHADFRKHSEAIDRAIEQRRPHSYVYHAGGHCPFNWDRLENNAK